VKDKMGRYYFGDIKGKFWFGVQSSYDAVNLGGIMSDNLMLYFPCNCELVCGKNFCDDCFDSFDDAFEEAKNQGFIDENANKELEDVLLYESNYIDMKFEGHQIEKLQGHIEELYQKIGHYINKFTMNKDDDYECDIELTNDNNIPQDELELELIARWCLAKQVEQCIIDKGECEFECEL
jgi:hypothetical protein